ncbi:hypothetical protein [Methylobacter tundripaludum]|uniref:hypothetical protein n=1 Tax=Methylobacter tundripaludum TaxID=173365 RepID=UPI0004DF610B|nr:hypothetical protein [Methylobacter tundripaludum]
MFFYLFFSHSARPAHVLVVTFYPEQTAHIENKLTAYTVGSLQRKLQVDVLLELIKNLLEHQNPAGKLKELAGLVVFSVDAFRQEYGWERFRPHRTNDFTKIPYCWMIYQESE